jgi:outer membrane murein-binding lipoprotein Lpp
VLYGSLPGRKPKLPEPSFLPSHFHWIPLPRYLPKCCPKTLRQLCQNYSRVIFETPLRYFPPSNKNTPAWRKRLQALSGTDPTEDDPTIVYMAGYLHTLDNQYDDLASHCTHLNSRVESLENQVRELTREKASLQESLEIAEGEETNTREAYRTLKMDYDKKLKKLAPARKICRKTRSQGC